MNWAHFSNDIRCVVIRGFPQTFLDSIFGKCEHDTIEYSGVAVRFFIFLCSITVWMGCPSSHKKPSNFDESPSEVLSHLRSCENKMFTASGVINTTTWSNGKRIKLEQLFIRSTDGNLRIDTLSPVGQPLSTLVFDGGRLLVYDQQAGVFYICLLYTSPSPRD